MSWKERLPTHQWLKLVGHTVAISSFMFVYLYVMQHPIFPVKIMPAMPPDDWTPLLPWTTWVYFSLWIYICMPSVLMASRAALWNYFLGALLMAVIGLGIFVGYPTASPTWDVDWSQYPAWIAFLKGESMSGNACPSMHVSYTVLAMLWSCAMLRTVKAQAWLHAVNFLWGLAIILSTMTTKQHVFIDVVIGALLGVMIFAVNMYCVRRTGVTL
ncbi:phosphatase PAP2 family protein [Cerasicoccus frondis]|uniref:phosphatase PAP2 family protein n=1 Tax=Cerasicoccus frondis TaxID=490090 RepID=UPI0028528A59|nr:phosphatase PAP2 family protein [Cerasicoccus frondis]